MTTIYLLIVLLANHDVTDIMGFASKADCITTGKELMINKDSKKHLISFYCEEVPFLK